MICARGINDNDDQLKSIGIIILILLLADIVDDGDIPLNCEGEVFIDPLTQDPPLLSGSEIEVATILSTI